MTGKEKSYIDAVERSIESFGSIQREFVLDKRGVHALVRLVEELGGHAEGLELNDPVILKGKKSVEKVITSLESQVNSLVELDPPERWETFHNTLKSSLEIQVKGYKEMFKVFRDSDVRHIIKGQKIVDRGITLLSGGIKQSRGGKRI